MSCISRQYKVLDSVFIQMNWLLMYNFRVLKVNCEFTQELSPYIKSHTKLCRAYRNIWCRKYPHRSTRLGASPVEFLLFLTWTKIYLKMRNMRNKNLLENQLEQRVLQLSQHDPKFIFTIITNRTFAFPAPVWGSRLIGRTRFSGSLWAKRISVDLILKV